MILGFILGPMFELNLRKVSQLFVMDPYSIRQHPIAIVFLLITIVTVVMNVRTSLKASKEELNAAAD